METHTEAPWQFVTCDSVRRVSLLSQTIFNQSKSYGRFTQGIYRKDEYVWHGRRFRYKAIYTLDIQRINRTCWATCSSTSFNIMCHDSWRVRCNQQPTLPSKKNVESETQSDRKSLLDSQEPPTHASLTSFTLFSLLFLEYWVVHRSLVFFRLAVN